MISEFSVALPPFANTGTWQTTLCWPCFRRVGVRYTTTFIGSALSVIATKPPFITVGVVPDPASTWLGLWMPELR